MARFAGPVAALILLMAAGVIGAWGLVGLVFIVTGAARYCPLYSLFGIRTISKPGQRGG